MSEIANDAYKYGFTTDIEAVTLGRGLTEGIVRAISAARSEPEFLLNFRLKAYKVFLTMREPKWAHVNYPPIDYQNVQYFSGHKSAAKDKPTYNSIDEVPQEILDTFAKLGIPLGEQKSLAGVAVDAVFDSVSIATTHQAKLYDAGVIFCSFSEAVHQFPALIERYLGSVVQLPTIILRRSTARCSVTARLCTSPRTPAVRLSCRPTSASTIPMPGSLNAR